MYIDAYSKTFVQETVFSLIVTLQFYLTMSILEQIFLDKCNETILESRELHANCSLSLIWFLCWVREGKKKKSYFGLLQASLACLLLWFPKFPNNATSPKIALQGILEHFCCPPFLQGVHFSSPCARCCDRSLSPSRYTHPPQGS